MISERSAKEGLTKELEIFDYFEIDKNLPKHKKIDDNDIYGKNSVMVGSGEWGAVPSNNWNNNKITLRTRIANWLLRKSPKHKKSMTVIEFFTGLTKSYEELSPIGEIAEHYENALKQATTMGQISLVESLKNIIDVARGEAYLIVMGLKKYVTEKQVIDFYEKVGRDKNLKLTWIKNFGRIIPENVYKIKSDIDERKIFDNYVILHYDPKDNGQKLTKKEIEKKKDPILFGVMKESRKLYYIADWKDEYCDLTLEEMFKTLKGKVLQINNNTVKTFIDKTKA
jgi:hypothetical protein